MKEIVLPQIDYNNFSKTRDTIQFYAQLLSAIKGSLVPHQKNWEEFSLKVYSNGFTTTPIPIQTENGIEALDLNLDMIEYKLIISYKNKRDEITLEQRSMAVFTKQLFEILSLYEIELAKPDNKFFDDHELTCDKIETTKLWNLFSQVYFLFLKLRGSTLKETSNINFWPHHFDLALLLFSGKLIDGQDPLNWDYSREQMNFGLSSGDALIQQPYFYVTAYPFDKTLLDIKLPEFAEWHTEGWNGLIIKLSQLVDGKVNVHSLLDLFSFLLKKNFD
jgi:Family of unknown function (DUF5996)